MIARSFVLAILFLAGPALAGQPSVETIVMVRHGEKPAQGLGQLSCRGLNRALALPAVLARRFGRPDAIFAPDPAIRKQDHGVAYDYVRPLATIEPAAIAFGLPVRADLGVFDLSGLQAALGAPSLAGSIVLVAWEHVQIVALARRLLAESGAGAGAVPDWDAGDFDSIYVVRIVRDGAARRAEFSRMREGLDGLPETCPQAAPK